MKYLPTVLFATAVAAAPAANLETHTNDAQMTCNMANVPVPDYSDILRESDNSQALTKRGTPPPQTGIPDIRIPMYIHMLHSNWSAEHERRLQYWFEDQVFWINKAYRAAGIEFELKNFTEEFSNELAGLGVTRAAVVPQIADLNVGGYDTLNLYYTQNMVVGETAAGRVSEFPIRNPNATESRSSCVMIDVEHSDPAMHASTAILEIGHWLGLSHPWDETECGKSEHPSIADTPPAGGPSIRDETFNVEDFEAGKCPHVLGCDGKPTYDIANNCECDPAFNFPITPT